MPLSIENYNLLCENLDPNTIYSSLVSLATIKRTWQNIAQKAPNTAPLGHLKRGLGQAENNSVARGTKYRALRAQGTSKRNSGVDVREPYSIAYSGKPLGYASLRETLALRGSALSRKLSRAVGASDVHKAQPCVAMSSLRDKRCRT